MKRIIDLPLPTNLHAARTVRRHLRTVGAPWDEQTLDTVLLLASEVVTNAVRHGRAPVSVRLTQHPRSVDVQVGDGGTVALNVQHQPRPMPADSAQSGRGLLLLELLAQRWGSSVWISRDGRARHVVWFSVRRV